ncbi:hypothetical protein FEF22_001810 [Texas Phoenix palm phytoplasma]|uniref:Effector n=1 Tax=Texas Phoenix palm phytoplasma TaxID=176709 RepID=A0ABS5BIV3_9MOLU|nr:hypothetical protein [Texas Phoenix palm phytoplasma]MBP3059511.1 hypothetical protein [Texas Phoenix palm phytoplasma]
MKLKKIILMSLIFLILFITNFFNYYNIDILKINFLAKKNEKIYKNIYIKDEKKYELKGSNQSSFVNNIYYSKNQIKIKNKNKIFDEYGNQFSDFSCSEINQKINHLEIQINELKNKNNQLNMEAKIKAIQIDNIKRKLLLKAQFTVPKDSELDSLVPEVNKIIQEVGRERCIKQ